MTFYRRKLPHWHPEGRAIFITWRLFGSLPKGTGKSACPTEDEGRRFRRLDAELDRAGSGPVWLGENRIAACVEDAILQGEKLGQYFLDAHVVMPNHVHILLDPQLALARITCGIKGVSARDANVILGRTGQHFWEDESYDHWVRDEAEFERIVSYIERNPVSAGLAVVKCMEAGARRAATLGCVREAGVAQPLLAVRRRARGKDVKAQAGVPVLLEAVLLVLVTKEVLWRNQRLLAEILTRPRRWRRPAWRFRRGPASATF